MNEVTQLYKSERTESDSGFIHIQCVYLADGQLEITVLSDRPIIDMFLNGVHICRQKSPQLFEFSVPADPSGEHTLRFCAVDMPEINQELKLNI